MGVQRRLRSILKVSEAQEPIDPRDLPQVDKLWERLKSTMGRPVLYKDPAVLLEQCLEYIQWAEEHPLLEERIMVVDKSVHREDLTKLRALTLGGLCLYLGIHQTTWREYAKKPDFSSVCSHIEEAIREQKYAGAAAGLLNHAIIARDLGLADKHEFTGAGGGPISTVNHEMTPAEAAAAYQATLKGG